MFVSGFTIVRNAQKYDYPVVEAITSILPLCDEVVVLVGKSEDDTLGLIQSINSDKIRIEHSVWDDSLREGGKVLAVETNKALSLVDPKSTWCFYIQADEVLDETTLNKVKDAMAQYEGDSRVEGLLFDYTHFFGNYDFVANSRTYYRKEIRVVKPLPGLESYRDAQGFRINNRKLQVKSSGGTIFHYGWVRHPEVMRKKIRDFHQLWHDDEWVKAREKVIADFDYSQIDSLAPFKGQHPACMRGRIENKNWNFQPPVHFRHKSLKDRVLLWLERTTGIRIGEYKNYRLV